MFGISSTEFAVILVIALLVVGPKQMPQVLRVLGRGYKKLNSFLKKSSQVIDDIMYDADRIADKAERVLSSEKEDSAPSKEEKSGDE